MTRLVLRLLAATVAACVAPPRQAPTAPVPPPVTISPPPPPAPAPDWRDRPYAAGDWRHIADATRPAARYQGADGTVLRTDTRTAFDYQEYQQTLETVIGSLEEF